MKLLLFCRQLLPSLQPSDCCCCSVKSHPSTRYETSADRFGTSRLARLATASSTSSQHWGRAGALSVRASEIKQTAEMLDRRALDHRPLWCKQVQGSVWCGPASGPAEQRAAPTVRSSSLLWCRLEFTQFYAAPVCHENKFSNN
mgnify:CR=1 FL=1